IGRTLSDASPVKVALIGNPAAAPISRRAPVPLLPQSTGAAGLRHTAPHTRHSPGAMRSTSAPNARTASAVCSTSSPSSRPLIRGRKITPSEILASQLRAAADAFGHVASGHFKMHAARVHALGLGDLEEAPDLGHDVAHQPRLQSLDGARIAVHRVDAPNRV